MFFDLHPVQSSFHPTCNRRREPVRQYSQLRREMDDLLAPAMYVLQHLSQPRVVTPKQQKADKNFVVKVDVQEFAPEELNVKMVDNFVVIEGKHEEKQDEHGYISRSFVRRYAIPEDVREEDITCNLSTDGVLLVTAPRRIEEPKQNEKTIPINFSGQPAAVTDKPKSTDGGEDETDKEPIAA